MIFGLPTIHDSSWMTLSLLFCLLLLVAIIAVSRGRFIYAVRNIPHPRSLPLIGNAYQLNTNLEEFFQNLIRWSRQYGDIFLIWVGTKPFIFFYTMETVQVLLSSSTHINKSNEYSFLIPWLGLGLITSNGQHWHHRRKLLTPTFHNDMKDDYFNCAKKEVDIMIDCLKKEIGKGFDIVPYAKRAALDVICNSSMGCSINAQTNLLNEYVLAVDKLSQIVQSRFTSIWVRWDFVFRLTNSGREHDRALKIVNNFVNKVIVKRKQEWQNNKDQNCNKPVKKRQVLLDYLLDISTKDPTLTDVGIRDEVNTFMFAGHDTTATSISWILYALGRRPEYQQQILDEYDKIIDKDEELTLDKMNKLVMLDACIKESWRLYPVAPLLGREIRSPIKIMEHTIPAGSTVLINTYLLHRDPRYFPEPDVYKPERFLSENKLPCYTYIPFSAGSRNCIGSKFAIIVVKMFILSILRAYHVESLIPEDELRLTAELVLVNVDGIPLKLTPRTR